MPKNKKKHTGKAGKKGNKGKGHGQQHKNKQHTKQRNKKSQPKKQNKNTQLHQKQQQELLQSQMSDCIDSMYWKHSKKHESMRTFFGIFTRQNQLQLRELMKASIPTINTQITDKLLKSTQLDDNRDINQFIFLGDVVIGGYVTELLNNSKDCRIRAICILPYFRNYGFGSRLLVKLIKGAVQRKKLVTVSLFIDEENKKGIAFFERFGFKIMQQQNEKNGMKKNAKMDEKTQNKEDDESKIKSIKMRLDLRIYRGTIMVLVKKQLKKGAMATVPTDK